MLKKLTDLLAILRAKDARTLTLLNPKSGFSFIQNINYSHNKSQNNHKKNLDIYLPKNNQTNINTHQKQKVLIFWHGGRWTDGDKDHYGFIGQAFASMGIITVIANYRVYPENIFPDCANDAAECTAWVLNNIAYYGGDPNQIYLMGHSSGAHLAVLISTNNYFLNQFNVHKKQLAGVIGIAGPYDFLPSKDADIQAIFPENLFEMAQPIYHIDSQTPPMCLLWGAKDTTVYAKNIHNLSAQLTQNNIKHTKIIYPKLNHVNILILLGSHFRIFGKIFGNIHQDILNFIFIKTNE